MDGKSKLPWESLGLVEGDIPWKALHEFAAAVVTDTSVADELIDLYDSVWQADFEVEHYEDLYVPAIFALASPQLGDESRRRIGRFLVEELAEAGYEDAEISIEVLTAACGCMGPTILPLVLEAIDDEVDTEGSWFHLWGLTALAASTDDSEVRERVIRACRELLRRADRREIDPMDAINAAWTLARMGCTDCSSLIRRVKKKSKRSFCHGDYADAVDLLEGRLDYTPVPELWESPVKEWLEPRWRMARDWYAKLGDEDSGDDTDEGIRRAVDLTERFLESPQERGLADELIEDAAFIVRSLLENLWVYTSSSPEEINKYALEEVLLDVLPRKVTADRDLFEKVAPVTEAFLKWLESEGILADTEGLIRAVRGWSETIVARGMDPGCWGMAKSFGMQMAADGIDMEDEQAVQRYIVEYNSQLLSQEPTDRPDVEAFKPRTPIVEQSPKIGRNQPCPCGSGRKYKKCCGSVKSTNVES